jgi:hypothetical protein
LCLDLRTLRFLVPAGAGVVELELGLELGLELEQPHLGKHVPCLYVEA